MASNKPPPEVDKGCASSPSSDFNDLSGKHPVSALMELCSKRRWGEPLFNTVSDTGDSHRRKFLMKVMVGGKWYEPSVASDNKKMAKSNAAKHCLREMGLVPPHRYKDLSVSQNLKDHIDRGFAYSLSGENKDSAIPLLDSSQSGDYPDDGFANSLSCGKDLSIPLIGNQSEEHADNGFVNPLSSDKGFYIPLLDDQESFSNQYPADEKASFIGNKESNDGISFANTLSNLQEDGENCSKNYLPHKSDEDKQEVKFSPGQFISEAGGAYQYTNPPPSSRFNQDRRSQYDGATLQCEERRPQREGFFSEGYTRFPPSGGQAAVRRDIHDKARFDGKAFPKSLENILDKIDILNDNGTRKEGSRQCSEPKNSSHKSFKDENTKNNLLKSRRSTSSIPSRRHFENKRPYDRQLTEQPFIPHTKAGGRELQPGGPGSKSSFRQKTNYQGMSYLKCQISTADHKICPKGFSFWYEVLPHMFYSHMEQLYQASITTSRISLSCPYNDPDLGIWCDTKFFTHQPYDCDKPFNEQLAQALFILTSHIEEAHNGRRSSDKCPVCWDDLLVRPYVGREMVQFWLHLVTHLQEFLDLPPGAVPGKPVKLSLRGELRCVCDYHFSGGYNYVSHIVNHHVGDIEAAASVDGWVKLNCPAAETCRFETRRVLDVEKEVELGLALSQLFDHIREWHVTGRHVMTPVHHCPTCLVSTREMEDHVVWRHVARHEDMKAYFCGPCEQFVLRREVKNHLKNCRAVTEEEEGKELKAVKGNEGNLARVGGKGDVNERLLQLSGSVHLQGRLPAGEVEIKPQAEMEYQAGIYREYSFPVEMEHKLPVGKMESWTQSEMENRMTVGEMEHSHPVKKMEYPHPAEMVEQMKQRIPVEMEHRIPVVDMEQRIPLLEMEERKRVLRISTRDSWSDKEHLLEGWEMTDPEGHQNTSGRQQHFPGGHQQPYGRHQHTPGGHHEPHVGRDSEKCYGDKGERNQLQIRRTRPEDNYNLGHGVQDSSMVEAQFLQQNNTRIGLYDNYSSTEKDFNENVKKPFIQEPEIGWGDFSNLEKPLHDRFRESVESNFNEVKQSNLDVKVKRFKVVDRKETLALDVGVNNGTGDKKNNFNVLIKRENEVTTSQEINKIESNDLDDNSIILKERKQNDFNEATPVQVIQHPKIKLTLLNREKEPHLGKNPGGSSPTVSSTFTQDMCEDTKSSQDMCESTKSSQDMCEDTKSSQDMCDDRKSSQDMCEDTKSSQDMCEDTKSSQDMCEDTKSMEVPSSIISSGENCKEETKLSNKQSVKQFTCDVCGTKFMKEHILNFHRAIHKN